MDVHGQRTRVGAGFYKNRPEPALEKMPASAVFDIKIN